MFPRARRAQPLRFRIALAHKNVAQIGHPREAAEATGYLMSPSSLSRHATQPVQYAVPGTDPQIGVDARPVLLDDLGNATRTDGAATLADGEA